MGRTITLLPILTISTVPGKKPRQMDEGEMMFNKADQIVFWKISGKIYTFKLTEITL